MKIKKEYRKLEDTLEISIYDILEKDLFVPVEPVKEMVKSPFTQTMKNLPCDLDIFIPYNKGEDFIVQLLGETALARGNFTQKDIEGRLLSQCSPAFYEILYDSLYEVYKTQKRKKMRFYYYNDGKLSRLAHVKLVYDTGRIILISEFKYTYDNKHYMEDEFDENKANLIEYFSQTGSYYKIKGKYTWTQGIYNIINRPREENDEYYNIVFDLAIPEDKALVEKMLKELDTGITSYETVIRIKTDEGMLKYLGLSLYSKFDDDGELISRYGLIKDVTKSTNKRMTRPVNFLLKGFKNSKKLGLLIEPLNQKQFEYSEGFYDIVEEDKQNYSNKRVIVENIVEQDTVENFRRLFRREINELDETFTYNVKGNPNNQKICEIYIEVFEFGGEEHSIGFLTDITEERKKQMELQEAYDNQTVLIKEVHHRVKNNLQVLNSFLNLEKRAYKDQPSLIIDHMQSRLSSLALLHEKTYNTTDFKNINLNDYIIDQDRKLESLIGLRDGITFESEIDNSINLSIEIITPLLLVVDELTMNSIKHAFPADWPDKKITKKITKLDENTGELIIKDNGIGIDETKKNLKHSLGCEIVKNLTRQLDGEIKYLDIEKGTGFRLLFPLTMEHTISQ